VLATLSAALARRTLAALKVALTMIGEAAVGLWKVAVACAKAVAVFAGPAEDSIKGHLNRTELGRVVVAALTAGAGLMGVLNAILANVATIFPSQFDAALGAVIVTVLIDVLRRLRHGAPAYFFPPPKAPR
jgi:hypothetical protein